jgi:xylitol oxidase
VPSRPLPHWGKIFTIPPDDLRARYERLPDFPRLIRRFDPVSKFSNAFTTRYLAA